MRASAKYLWDTWLYNSESRSKEEAIVHWVGGEQPFRWNWGELVRAAVNYAEAIRSHGVRPGEICALIIRHHKDFYPIYMGISLMGGIPSILAYPNPRQHPDKFRQGLEGMSRHSGLDWIFSERSLEDTIKPLVQSETSTIRGILFPLEWKPEIRGKGTLPESLSHSRRGTSPDDPCLLQHSSGTTGLQKAVVLSHRAVMEHVRLYGESIQVNGEDKIASWLPLYHDMGLIAAFLLPLAWGIPLIQLDPFEWVQAPVLLLEAISREKGTLAWLPNFAYNFMADRIREEDLEGLRFDSVRMLVNCSEPVRHESHQKFLRRFSPLGLSPDTLGASYAMAETVFAATQTEPGTSAKMVPVSRSGLAQGHFQPVHGDPGSPTKYCVSSGAPISGCDLKVVDEKGGELPDGEIGEIVIGSVSLFDGYRNQPEKTEEVLKDGWYYSGDYGARHEGEYYILGRKKDIIIVAGNNISPEDVEDAVNEVPGILPGRVVAFDRENEETGTEQVCVVAETEETGEAGLKALRREIVKAGMRIDVTVAEVYLVPPRWLFKSSSGKLSRKTNKQRVLDTFSSRGQGEDAPFSRQVEQDAGK